MGKIKIIGGKYRSRILNVLDIDGLRPTLGRVRETLFNWLGQDLTNKKCIDLFAGTGALGLESISRNAKHVVFVELHKSASNNISNNLRILGASNAEIINKNALEFISNAHLKYDIIFIDPPYLAKLFIDICKLLPNIANSDSLIYLEYSSYPDGLSEYLQIVKQAKAGSVTYGLYKLL